MKKMKTKLKEVVISKKDTCLSYVLKRAGIDTDIQFVEDLHNDFDFIPVKETCMRIGDIVAWQKKEEAISVGTSIDENGSIIHSEVYTKYHLGVVEGSHLISDLTRSANPYYIPSIRTRYVSLTGGDYQVYCPFPDFVIRKKT